MIIVTGAAGFIGSNLVYELNQRGRNDVIAVDNLTKGIKYRNLVDCQIEDYIDKEDLFGLLDTDNRFSNGVDAVFHLGACSSTTEWDGRFMMNNNYRYTRRLLDYCLQHGTQYIYASSAAVYGGNHVFREDPQYEAPLNVYGYSKLLMDQHVRRVMPQAKSQIVGLRYFNVYGPREQHKGSMASVAYHHRNQLMEDQSLKLFEGCDGYDNGEQRRDFVYVGDTVDVKLWLLDNPQVSGIFNVGTGTSQPFNDIGHAVISYHNNGEIEYIPFPEHLKGCYQSFTEADISALRNAGYDKHFRSVEQGVHRYMEWLDKSVGEQN